MNLYEKSIVEQLIKMGAELDARMEILNETIKDTHRNLQEKVDELRGFIEEINEKINGERIEFWRDPN